MTTEEKTALQKFGKMLTEEVYDSTFECLQGIMLHGMRGKKLDPFHVAYRSLDARSADVVRRFVVEAIGQTLAQFLNFLDVHEVPIMVDAENGRQVDVRAASDGLAAEPFTEWGWIAQFSKFKDGFITT